MEQESSCPPITERTKDRVWQEMWDIARHVHYYELQTNRLTLFNRCVRVTLLLGAALSVAAAVDDGLSVWVAVAGATLLFLMTALDFVWDWGRRAALSHAINLECYVIQKDYEDLWLRISNGQVGEEESQARVNQLVMRVVAATSQLVETDRRLNKKAQKAATRILELKWRGQVDNPKRTTATAI